MRKYLITITILLFYSTNFVLAQNYTVEETSFKNDSLTLFADIYIPKVSDKKVGIALIQGSDNNDRRNLWSKTFAEILAENGYYFLLPNKRGCGKSEGSWKNSLIELSEDAIASVDHLKIIMKLERCG